MAKGLEIERKFLLHGIPEFPDKIRLDITQSYCSNDSRINLSSNEILNLKKKIEEIKEEKISLVRSQKYEEVVQLRSSEQELQKQLEIYKNKWNDLKDEIKDIFRVRRTQLSSTEIEYHKTTKKLLRPGVYEEEEELINDEEYFKYLKSSFKKIKKTRYEIHKPSNGISLVWQIDVYDHMIVAEVELPTEDYELEIPDFIKDVLVMEVTQFKEFTNFNLAKDII